MFCTLGPLGHGKWGCHITQSAIFRDDDQPGGITWGGENGSTQDSSTLTSWNWRSENNGQRYSKRPTKVVETARNILTAKKKKRKSLTDWHPVMVLRLEAFQHRPTVETIAILGLNGLQPHPPWVVPPCGPHSTGPARLKSRSIASLYHSPGQEFQAEEV